MPYNCLYLNKGNNSSVKGSILTKLIGYREFMVLIICTKNELNLTNRYRDMVPDRQKVRTDGRNGRTDGQTDGRTDDAKTISLRLRRGITRETFKITEWKHLVCKNTYTMTGINNRQLFLKKLILVDYQNDVCIIVKRVARKMT